MSLVVKMTEASGSPVQNRNRHVEYQIDDVERDPTSLANA